VLTVAHQQQQQAVTRREAGLAAAAVLAALAAPQPAHALFGLGGEKAAERYERETVSSRARAARRVCVARTRAGA
jgi:hypothetical protein